MGRHRPATTLFGRFEKNRRGSLAKKNQMKRRSQERSAGERRRRESRHQVELGRETQDFADAESTGRSSQLPKTQRSKTRRPKFTPTRLRIVAGEFGGRKIDYNGDPATRPMKEKTRESLFSLLGGYLYNTLAVDLFGGTGILAFESISRGADRAIILEMARPAVSMILANMKMLNLENRVEVHNVDTLRWLRSLDLVLPMWPDLPWVVYCCPPYRMWKTDTQRLCDGLASMMAASPVGSRFVCETELDFDLAAAMPGLDWNIRPYSPANLAIWEKS